VSKITYGRGTCMYVDLETCTIGGFYRLIKLRPAKRERAP
jgi:hypothetical protein